MHARACIKYGSSNFAIFLQPEYGFTDVGANPSRSTCADIIANYPDFPKQGIVFRDINPVSKGMMP